MLAAADFLICSFAHMALFPGGEGSAVALEVLVVEVEHAPGAAAVAAVVRAGFGRRLGLGVVLRLHHSSIASRAWLRPRCLARYSASSARRTSCSGRP